MVLRFNAYKQLRQNLPRHRQACRTEGLQGLTSAVGHCRIGRFLREMGFNSNRETDFLFVAADRTIQLDQTTIYWRTNSA